MSESDSNYYIRYCNKCKCDTDRNSHNQCKPCVRARARAWRAANPDKKKAYQKEYNKTNGVLISGVERKNKYQYESKEKNAARKRKYKAENPEKVRLAEKKWREKNLEVARERTRLCQHSRRDAVKSSGKLSYGLVKKLVVLQKGKCACCGRELGKDYHLDHIMPLALGGTNTDDNIQLLRKQCNLQKNKKHPVEFMQSRGFLL